MSDDRITVPVRLTANQHELLRRRCIANQTTMQTALSAAANAVILGDLAVRANGRYFVSGPTLPVSRDDEVTLRAPTTIDVDRTLTIRQPPAEGSSLGTRWLVQHLHQRSGKRVSPRMLRKLLAHLENKGRVEEREGRYWRFTGSDDPNVVAVAIALDDGTLDLLVEQGLGLANNNRDDGVGK